MRISAGPVIELTPILIPVPTAPVDNLVPDTVPVTSTPPALVSSLLLPLK